MLKASALPVMVGVRTLVMRSVFDAPELEATARISVSGAAGACVSMTSAWVLRAGDDEVTPSVSVTV